ncbi:MAG: radical SAM protein [Planctomycetes bacterium]|nr:radical SAM protein [Planctomycetota bacterium]MCA8935969.1 radical SAM protein [Planctomycetota bacterium]MCA8945560.1 radical SAM protein [Planctomycetota bacterium]
MRYEGRIYRPPSEANSYILQATIGCSWNHCTYCDMYRDKQYHVRDEHETLQDITLAASAYGQQVDKVFVADGDALVMTLEQWRPLLSACRENFPRLRRVSAYATARNLLEKTPEELALLREWGLSLLYIGPESGDDETLKRIAKGGSFAEHTEAAKKARDAGIKLSAIFLLGAGGIERSTEHAMASAHLATQMDPRFVSCLTLTVVPGTPIARLEESGRFELPDIMGVLTELRTFVDMTRPSDAIFRTNHASNYLPLAGRLPRDRERIVGVLDAALSGEIPLRPDWARGL